MQVYYVWDLVLQYSNEHPLQLLCVHTRIQQQQPLVYFAVINIRTLTITSLLPHGATAGGANGLPAFPPASDTLPLPCSSAASTAAGQAPAAGLESGAEDGRQLPALRQGQGAGLPPLSPVVQPIRAVSRLATPPAAAMAFQQQQPGGAVLGQQQQPGEGGLQTPSKRRAEFPAGSCGALEQQTPQSASKRGRHLVASPGCGIPSQDLLPYAQPAADMDTEEGSGGFTDGDAAAGGAVDFMCRGSVMLGMQQGQGKLHCHVFHVCSAASSWCSLGGD
jgi:hypothetical protein